MVSVKPGRDGVLLRIDTDSGRIEVGLSFDDAQSLATKLLLLSREGDGVIDAAALHRAAERVSVEAGTPEMDALAAAGVRFLHESDFHDEYGTPFVVSDPRALGYGIMLGYLAAQEERG